MILCWLNSDIIGLPLQEPAEVTFASSEYQSSGTAAILDFSYWKIIYYCHCFLTAVSKEKRGKDLSVFCDLTAGIHKILLQGLLAGHLWNGLKTLRRKGKLFAQFHLFRLVLAKETVWLRYWASVKPTAELKIFPGASLLHCEENTYKRRIWKRLLIKFLSSQVYYAAKFSLAIWESILMSIDWTYAFLPCIFVLCLLEHISFLLLINLSLFSILRLKLCQYVCHLGFWMVALVS